MASQSELETLRDRVEGLEKRLRVTDPTAELKLGDKGFSYAISSIGILTFELIKTESFGSGTKATLKIGNITAARISRMELYGFWQKSSASGEPTESTVFPRPLQIDEPCPGGSWCTVTVIIEGVRPVDLGAISITSASIEDIALKTGG